LKNFGVRPGPFHESEDISDLMDWIETEFQALPDVISGASDFAAAFFSRKYSEATLRFRLCRSCEFHENLSHFLDAGSTAIIHPNGDVQAIKFRFVREFWFASGKEFAKKIARAKLDKVCFWHISLNFQPLTTIFMLIFSNPFFLLVFLQLIQSEEHGKADFQESSSEVEEDGDADNEEDGSGDEGSNGSQDNGEEASSDHETSSPKVDIVG
jgi:hypothetical protein